MPVWSEGRDPVRLAKNGVKEAQRTGADVVIIDTAGRLHVDPEMMKQARKIKDVTKPHHVVMACDAMTGQDAVVQAREFMREVDTTGFILTKLDGDARGGAALSMTAVTGRPDLLRRDGGEGRRPRALLPRPDGGADPRDGRRAHPDREGAGHGRPGGRAEGRRADAAAASSPSRTSSTQLREMRKLGPIQDLLKMLPGMPGGKAGMKELAEAVDEGELGGPRPSSCR